MHSRSLGMPIAVTATALLAVGCSSGSHGEPTADVGSGGFGASTSEPAFEDPGAGSAGVNTGGGPAEAPKVSDPLDASKYLSRPCDVLSAAKLKSFGMNQPGRADNSNDVRCSWQDRRTGATIGVSFISGNPHGLSDFYAARASKPKGYFGYFEPTTVNGYPAVFNDATDGRSFGDCALAVGITDKMILSTGETNGDGPKSCAVAKQVAAAVITTLKGKA